MESTVSRRRAGAQQPPAGHAGAAGRVRSTRGGRADLGTGGGGGGLGTHQTTAAVSRDSGSERALTASESALTSSALSSS